MIRIIRDFLQIEASSGIVLLVAAALAMVLANSTFLSVYETIQAPQATFWINDVLMSFFFLLIGIEIKQQIQEGELSGKGQLLLPCVAAAGGVALPALIYWYFNAGQPTMRGWAIPTATDIAFSLAVLALFGKRIAPSLRIFLMAVAVIDDLIAVIIIASFYTGALSYAGLAMASACCVLIATYKYRHIDRPVPYILAGFALWVSTLDSGVHPTIAAFLLGLLLPASLGRLFMNKLHMVVAFGVMPLFAFANGGVNLSGMDISHALNAFPLSIVLGLFAGKQIGIFFASLMLVFMGRATLPKDSGWLEFYAVCMIAGIGFTMSLFIGSLAFTDKELMIYTRLGVIMGSLASALGGALLMVTAICLRSKKL